MYFKTSLTVALKKAIPRSRRDKVFHPIGNHDEISTNGIEIHCTNAKKNDIQLDIWDFGGQEVFYPTHQFFLSDKSIYLIVFKCTGLNESKIEYWLNTIRSITNNSLQCIVYLVGTHCDLVTKESIDNIRTFLSNKFQKQFYRFLQPEIFFTNPKGDSVNDVYQSIIEKIRKNQLLPLIIPSSWATFYQYLENLPGTVYCLFFL